LGQVTQQYVVVCVSALGVLAAESAHRVTGVATFILLADMSNQRLWTLHFDFEGGDQRTRSESQGHLPLIILRND
jgi:hypothetical protein